MDSKKAASLTWGASPAGTLHAKDLKPGSKEFFETVRERRLQEEFPWLHQLVPFSKMKGKKVLEVGCGAGYDAYEFCRYGADYSGIDIAPENPILTRKHLGFYGYSPKVTEGDAENLQFNDKSFEVVYSNGVLHHTPDILRSFKEAYRVLKPGGFFWVIVYHKNSIFYWFDKFLICYILRLGFLKRSFKEEISMIEYNTSGIYPLVNAYSRRGLKIMLKRSGFTVEHLRVRKLVLDDVIPVARIQKYFRWFLPQKMLDNIGKVFGWYLIVKAIKKV